MISSEVESKKRRLFFSQQSVSLVSMQSCLLRRHRSFAVGFCPVRSSKEDFVADEEAPAVVKSPSSPGWESLVSSWMVAIRISAAQSGWMAKLGPGSWVLALAAEVAQAGLSSGACWEDCPVRPAEDKGSLTRRDGIGSKLLAVSGHYRENEKTSEMSNSEPGLGPL